ncbi:putative bifunctional diguanylate cyclase/phosphodiesterase [Desulfoluna spongiiphila]|uniref:putative bifunctional diguanylate cyclase/phosphodiesterase n=1 Tax=Desulfoluna spongiiphila TaxID=419481 RepID=UPI0012568754|nr:EAL domain-containing protein [Desulfoluna spongiiphila]VVS91258.1 nucleotide cyclase [Desulfoluna spongiiphila]
MEKPTLLIIDDIPSNIDVLGTILMEDYIIQAATSGEEGLGIAQEGSGPDLILLDVMMPGMDGYEVLSRLKVHEATRHIPVIMVTACTDAADETKGFRLGCADYLHKPVTPLIVQSRVRTQVEVKRGRDALAASLETSRADSLRQGRFLGGLFDHSPQGILLLDEAHAIVRANQAFCDLFGYRACDLEGQAEPMNTVPVAEAEAYGALLETIDARGRFKGEGVRMRVDGTPLSVSIAGCRVDVENQSGGIFLIYEDITDRKLAEKRLTHQAYHDALTGIDNRLAFVEGLKGVLKENRRVNRCCVMLLDLDRFKSVNDSLGHPVGDALLQVVSRRFTQCLRDRDTVARIGGDEFAVLLRETRDASEVEGISRRLLDAASSPFEIDGQVLHIGASIGVVFDLSGYTDPDTVIRDADLAMYEAKASGRGRFTLFDSTLHEKAVHRLEIERELRDAFVRGEFEFYYQPILTLPEGPVERFEALIRWNHPEKGVLAPAAFLSVLEEAGLSTALRCWVVESAAQTLATWGLDFPGRILNINLTASQLGDPELCPFITEVFGRYGASPDRLVVEITETDFMEGRPLAEANLNRLREAGVRIAIDDFGTGYSSLAYLHRYRIDTLKIDRSFITRIDQDGLAIISAIASISQKLGVSVVAEGIEEPAQLDAVMRAGCTHAQGYLISRPMPLERATCSEHGRAGWLCAASSNH